MREDFRVLIEILNTFSNITKTALYIKAYYDKKFKLKRNKHDKLR